MPNSLLLSVAKDFILGDTKPMETLTLPVEGSWENATYEGSGSVLDINVEQNREALAKFLED
ncbi:hypothetical protein [Carnobacterium maltaromaticum]|uniref:hypothetical protein n=1 Tax=Carnobacterium maltaromaticum TaxID=2751 RepID=UPI00215233E2|nr:hypothetical protein [Carnobacterium maltaromaticum]